MFLDIISTWIVYISKIKGPPSEVYLTSTWDGALKDGEEEEINCTASNSYPAPQVFWYVGANEVTSIATRHEVVTTSGRYDVEGSLKYVFTHEHDGENIACCARHLNLRRKTEMVCARFVIEVHNNGTIAASISQCKQTSALVTYRQLRAHSLFNSKVFRWKPN